MSALVRRHRHVAALLLLMLTVGLGTTMGAGEQLRRAASVSGGGALSAGSLRLQSSIGQPAIGAVRNQVVLCSGLQCGPGAPELRPDAGAPVYLPMVVRE